MNASNEYNMKELLEIILKEKRVVFITMFTLLVMTGGYILLLTTPTYEANVLLTINPLKTSEKNIDGIESTIDYTRFSPEVSVESYKEQILAPQVLNNVITQLDLKKASGESRSYNSLRKQITVASIKNTNMLTISVKGQNPEEVAQIANTLSHVFADYITENSVKQNNIIAKTIEEQLEIESKNVEAKSNAIVLYLKQGVNIEQLSQEVNQLVKQVTNVKVNISKMEERILQDEIALEILNNNQSSKSEHITLKVSYDNSVQRSMVAMEKTKIETRLIKNKSSLEALTSVLDTKEENLRTKKIQLEKEKYTYGMLQNDLSLAKQTYNAYLNRHKEIVVSNAADIGNSSITVFSEAITPQKPLSNHMIMLLLVAILGGGCLGIAIVLGKHAWNDSL